jgi:sulfur carrier protein ThiS
MERAYLDGADVAMAQATLSDLIARIDLEAERYATE